MRSNTLYYIWSFLWRPWLYWQKWIQKWFDRMWLTGLTWISIWRRFYHRTNLDPHHVFNVNKTLNKFEIVIKLIMSMPQKLAFIQNCWSNPIWIKFQCYTFILKVLSPKIRQSEDKSNCRGRLPWIGFISSSIKIKTNTSIKRNVIFLKTANKTDPETILKLYT